MEYLPVRISDLMRKINKDIYLPAIQREFVWDASRIERLFDSVMQDFPIGSFLWWKVEQENKNDWPIYQFVSDYDEENPHNDPANLNGVNKDILLVLDGQQRITSLLIGLKGTHRSFYYRWRKNILYLNLYKAPLANEENPEELTYEFAFRETANPAGSRPQLWYRVGKILDFEDAEDAKSDIKSQIASASDDLAANANRLIGKLHNRVHTTLVGNYYEEKSQDYEKVLQVFVRANSAGQPLEYSDLLLATATAKWDKLNAREEINRFTDEINRIGTGYNFGKDFVLKACLFLTDLPIQYKVKNFNRKNLLHIEQRWPDICSALITTVKLISRFGFNSKNVVAPLALLPIAYFLMARGKPNFDTSSDARDVSSQLAIRRWFIFATLKNAFGGSSDTTLARLRELMKPAAMSDLFPEGDFNKSLGISPSFSEAEIARVLEYGYQGRYTNLVLSLLYPDKDWKDSVYHEDHIFPQAAFKKNNLLKAGLNAEEADFAIENFNRISNLQLLTDTENLSKNSTPFAEWIQTRDEGFMKRHNIPKQSGYALKEFPEFVKARAGAIRLALGALGV